MQLASYLKQIVIKFFYSLPPQPAKMSSVRSFLNDDVDDDDDDWSSLLSTALCGDIPLPIPLPDPFPEADFPFPLPLTNPNKLYFSCV